VIRANVIAKVADLYCRDLEHVRYNIAPIHWGVGMSPDPPKGLDVQASVAISVVPGNHAGKAELKE
jgi:hypothetical protein